MQPDKACNVFFFLKKLPDFRCSTPAQATSGKKNQYPMMERTKDPLTGSADKTTSGRG